MACAARCRRRDAGAGRMTTDAPIPADPTTRREAVVWIAAAVATIAARFVARQLTARRPVWAVLAVAAAVAAGAWTWRAGTVTVGAEHVNAASEPGKSGPALQDIAVDPLLQDGYADPAAGEDDRAAVDDPMVPLVPDAAAEESVGPAGEPLPAWLPPTVARWEAYIRAGAAPYGVDPTLVAIVMTIESAGNPRAGSKAGARSLLQVMPATAAGIDRERGRPHNPETINDPTANIDFGVYNLAWCLRTYGVPNDPDWRQSIGRACRCYNGGPPAVEAPPEESIDHERWVVGMWGERHDATSPTFDRWRADGGQVALDIAATTAGPEQQEAMADER